MLGIGPLGSMPLAGLPEPTAPQPAPIIGPELSKASPEHWKQREEDADGNS